MGIKNYPTKFNYPNKAKIVKVANGAASAETNLFEAPDHVAIYTTNVSAQ